jgi:hypothetical protein
MTAPRIDDIPPLDSGAAWTNENGCAYCAFRPLAPPGTPKEDEWKYGTGDGAHNPIIRSLVGIKPIV